MSPYNYVLGNPISLIDPTGLAPETIYKNKETGEEVEVNDGIDKTIEVNADDFEKAKDFASRSEVADWLDTENGWSQSDQQEYYDFYHSVNSYEGFSIASLYDYYTGGPDNGRPELSPGGPAGKAGGATVASMGVRVPKGKVFYDTIKKKIVKGGQWVRKKKDGYIELLTKGKKTDFSKTTPSRGVPWKPYEKPPREKKAWELILEIFDPFDNNPT